MPRTKAPRRRTTIQDSANLSNEQKYLKNAIDRICMYQLDLYIIILYLLFLRIQFALITLLWLCEFIFSKLVDYVFGISEPGYLLFG